MKYTYEENTVDTYKGKANNFIIRDLDGEIVAFIPRNERDDSELKQLAEKIVSKLNE